MRAKLESGFEDVSILIFIDVGPLLVSILDPKIDKNRTKNQANFRNDVGRDFGGFGIQSGIGSGRPGVARAECARLLEA